jgi:GrpB-like predicted nucleotidyltransferase (UPF0157 family)/aminoglycoside phosphotransferase (APT) family kinase protein
MPVSQRSADVALDAGVVAGVLAAQFPEFAAEPVRRFGAGWDNELYTAGAGWIFRFPKRRERVPWLTREIQIMTAVGHAVGPAAPRFEHVGAPSERFPYPFVGYRRLPGVGADQSPVADLAVLAADIGGLLSRLHRIDAAGIPPTPDGWEREPWHVLREDLAAEADVIRPLLPDALLARAEPYLNGAVTEPPQDGPIRFVHNDICPDHLLVDPATGRLTGLIDFTDAMTGEVVLDFVGLIGVGGYDFIRQVTASYDLPLGDTFWPKLGWLTRTLTLSWVAEAAHHDPASVPKHLEWLRRAFGDDPAGVPAVVVDYDPAWPTEFEILRAAADAALGEILHVTEHVGSTAVPGLAAKPIIDIDVVVPSAAAVGPAVAALARAGWQPEGEKGISGREAFLPPPGLQYHHLYVVVQGSQAHRDHVDLRDFLRAHPEQAARYAELKRELAPLLRTDREAYVDGKADLVTDLLRRARQPGSR